jgi:hypothetical protein
LLKFGNLCIRPTQISKLKISGPYEFSNSCEHLKKVVRVLAIVVRKNDTVQQFLNFRKALFFIKKKTGFGTFKN